MAPYSQTCQCRGRGLSAVKDIRRYLQEIHDIGLDIARLEREREQVQIKVRHAQWRMLEEPAGACSVCSGSGVVESRGEISGNNGQLRASDWATARRIG